MSALQETPTVGEHCLTVASGEQWSAASADSASFAAIGTALNVEVKVFGSGDTLRAEPVVHEEEVATILEGSFRIQADDEQYELTVGEGIIIPPSTERVWYCTSEKGVLYRVLTKSQPPAEE